jgi:hypothetical protein
MCVTDLKSRFNFDSELLYTMVEESSAQRALEKGHEREGLGRFNTITPKIKVSRRETDFFTDL